jgi:endonuclease-3
MSSPTRAKTTDRQEISRKLVNTLKKRYKTTLPKQERSILDTLLYAICLEDASPEEAEAALKRLLEVFHDLNEVRVSSISELAVVFDGMVDPEWRAARVRGVLQYVFDKHFEFAFETLRRKTLELATKQLLRIKELSPFVRSYTLQSALGSHIVPVDRQMTNATIWLGLVPAGESPQQAAELLRVIVRKADTPLFCHLLRSFAVDPKVRKAFDFQKHPAPAGGFDLSTAPERLEHLLKHGASAVKASARGRAAAQASRDKGKRERKTTRPAASRDGAHRGSRAGAERKPARKGATVRKKK